MTYFPTLAVEPIVTWLVPDESYTAPVGLVTKLSAPTKPVAVQVTVGAAAVP